MNNIPPHIQRLIFIILVIAAILLVVDSVIILSILSEKISAKRSAKRRAEIREKISGSWRFVHRKIYKETNGSHLLILDAKKVDNQNQKVKITRFWKYLAWYPNGFWPSVYELRYKVYGSDRTPLVKGRSHPCW